VEIQPDEQRMRDRREDATMAVISHVADDYAAIARRLKELAEENERAEQQASQPVHRAGLGQTPYRLRPAEAGGHRAQLR
jgi:hypothetical protein